MSWTAPKDWVLGEYITEADLDAQISGNLNFLKNNIALEAAAELTIATGAITKTQSHHTVDTAADAATDDLNCINGGAEGEVLFIRPANGARTIVVKHQSGAEGNNIWNPSGEDVTLDDADDCLILLHDGSKWCVVGGGSASDLAAHIADTDPHTQYQKESEKGIASGYASLDASIKVVEQPASISDHVLDEDDMVSNSAVHVPTQQSVKAYVDAAGGVSEGTVIALIMGLG
jgi:hypothetical protein